jgi:hypothetical protein
MQRGRGREVEAEAFEIRHVGRVNDVTPTGGGSHHDRVDGGRASHGAEGFSSCLHQRQVRHLDACALEVLGPQLPR